MPLVAGVLSCCVVLPLVDVLLSVVDVVLSVVARIHSPVVVPLVAGVLPLVAGISLCLKSTWKFGSSRYTKMLRWLMLRLKPVLQNLEHDWHVNIKFNSILTRTN